MTTLETPFTRTDSRRRNTTGMSTIIDVNGSHVFECYTLDADEIIKRINGYEAVELKLSEQVAYNEGLLAGIKLAAEYLSGQGSGDPRHYRVLNTLNGLKEQSPNNLKANAIAEYIHYPECWDTMAYPTLEAAVDEMPPCPECNKMRQLK